MIFYLERMGMTHLWANVSAVYKISHLLLGQRQAAQTILVFLLTICWINPQFVELLLFPLLNHLTQFDIQIEINQVLELKQVNYTMLLTHVSLKGGKGIVTRKRFIYVSAILLYQSYDNSEATGLTRHCKHNADKNITANSLNPSSKRVDNLVCLLVFSDSKALNT